MPKLSNSLLLVAGGAIGLAVHMVTRTKSTPDAEPVKAGWEDKLARVADLPWGMLHPALRVVSGQNMKIGIAVGRAVHGRTAWGGPGAPVAGETPVGAQEGAKAAPKAEKASQVSQEPKVAPQEAETPAADANTEPTATDDSAPESNDTKRDTPKVDTAEALNAFIGKATAVGAQLADKYSTDEQFRNRVDGGLTKASALLREVRATRKKK